MSSRRKRGGALFGNEEIEEMELKIVKMFIEAGANLMIKAKDGKSPFTLAFEGGLSNLLKLFGKDIDLN